MSAVVNGLNVGDYIQVLVTDGMVFEWVTVSIGVNHMIADSGSDFSGRVCIEYKYIIEYEVRKLFMVYDMIFQFLWENKGKQDMENRGIQWWKNRCDIVGWSGIHSEYIGVLSGFKIKNGLLVSNLLWKIT